MTTNLRQAALGGFKWTTVSQVGQQGIGFATTFVLARLLVPADFGLINMAMIVIGFVNVFRDLGTSSAIIQRKELSPALLSSVFWANFAFGLVMMVGLAAASPAIAAFYHEPRITPIMRVLSLTFFLSCLSTLPLALLQHDLAFDRLARIELSASSVGAVVGIGAALLGRGAWSLVYQSLAAMSATTVLLWLMSAWRPGRLFSWAEVRAVAGYSSNITSFNIFNYFTRNMDNLLIGRFLGARDLGYYALAYRLMMLPAENISAIILRVMFPTYAKLQDDDARFRRVYLQVSSAIALITFPVFFGLIAVSKPFILTAFGSQWRPVIPLIVILGVTGMGQSLERNTGSIYRVKGRPDWQLRVGIVSTALFLPAFVLGLRWGVVGVTLAYAVVVALLTYPTYAIPFRLIGLRVSELGAALWRPLASGALMCAAVVGLGAILPGTWRPQLTLGLLVSTGVALYLAASWLVNREQVCRVLGMLRARWLPARAGGRLATATGAHGAPSPGPGLDAP
ncbi:MAG TPA: MOP flippase family protein [Thermomicrobiales bacterium]|nr:MOP flippase family protein [Thermomicrobiales bacterium]